MTCDDWFSSGNGPDLADATIINGFYLYVTSDGLSTEGEMHYKDSSASSNHFNNANWPND